MSGNYYPYGWWCHKYGMWCDDVVDITEGNNECNGDCKECDHSDEHIGSAGEIR